MREHEETNVRLSERIARVIHQLRVPLLVLVIVMAVSVVGYFIYSEISANARERVAANVEAADALYLEWLFEQDEATKARLEESLLSRLAAVQEKYGRQYGGQRATFLKGQLYLEKEDYEAALVAFRRLADTAADSYLGGEGLYNMAVVFEETGQTEDALSAYQQVVSDHGQSVHAPHAQFSVGRILEGQDKYQEAAAAYDLLRSTHPNSGWTNFAVNRIIWLKSTGKVSGE